jgi:hypothetical protein
MTTPDEIPVALGDLPFDSALQHLVANCRIAGPGIDEAPTPLLRRLMLRGGFDARPFQDQ